ncbi:MAG TPA: DUF1684 domain-containing protein [Myxococcales bacterium]|nr:DUF1684 domain-containing protein [Myxococcales bacterium]
MSVLDLQALQKERADTLAAFHDGHRSPLAAVARHDFAGKPMTLGSAQDADVQLEGLAPHAAIVRVAGDHFEIDRDGRTEKLPPGGARVELGRYTLRLSHQNFPALLVLDPHSPRLSQGPFPAWFDADPAARVEARLVQDLPPREEIVLSTRGNKRHALRLGQLEFTLQGKALRLTALRLLEPGAGGAGSAGDGRSAKARSIGEAEVSVFFRDQTTGHESYPVGRYVEAEPLGDGRYVLDFNRAYNPTCAFSPLYNCPIPPRENVLPVAVRAGERDPGGH